MLHAAAVEDSEPELAQIQEFFARCQAERGVAMTVSSFWDSSEIPADYRPVYDVIFLDIEMPQVDGMAAAERIRQTVEQYGGICRDVLLVVVNKDHFDMDYYGAPA